MPQSRPEFCALLLAPGARALCFVALVALFSACSPEIGDDCATALDCSASGTRLCDMTQRGGYCTLEGCEENTCPDEAVCVQFGRRLEGHPVERLARTFCMLKCDSNGDCRTDQDYACFSAKDFGAGGGKEAVILGSSTQKFCAEKPATFEEVDAGTPKPKDAGMSTMPEDDAGMSVMPEEDGGSPGE
jgi:hypothetical protein